MLIVLQESVYQVLVKRQKGKFYEWLLTCFLVQAFPDFSGRLVESYFVAVEYLMDLLGHVPSGLSLVRGTPISLCS